MHSEKTVSGRY